MFGGNNFYLLKHHHLGLSMNLPSHKKKSCFDTFTKKANFIIKNNANEKIDNYELSEFWGVYVCVIFGHKKHQVIKNRNVFFASSRFL